MKRNRSRAFYYKTQNNSTFQKQKQNIMSILSVDNLQNLLQEFCFASSKTVLFMLLSTEDSNITDYRSLSK